MVRVITLVKLITLVWSDSIVSCSTDDMYIQRNVSISDFIDGNLKSCSDNTCLSESNDNKNKVKVNNKDNNTINATDMHDENNNKQTRKHAAKCNLAGQPYLLRLSAYDESVDYDVIYLLSSEITIIGSDITQLDKERGDVCLSAPDVLPQHCCIHKIR